MTNKQLTFAFFGDTFQLRKSTSLARALDYLRSRDERVIFDRPFRDFLMHDQHLDLSGVEVFDGDDFDADYAVSIGGDGTFLKTAVRIGCKNTPIVGINMGRLGFLADVLPDEVENALAAIIGGDYK